MRARVTWMHTPNDTDSKYERYYSNNEQNWIFLDVPGGKGIHHMNKIPNHITEPLHCGASSLAATQSAMLRFGVGIRLECGRKVARIGLV